MVEKIILTLTHIQQMKTFSSRLFLGQKNILYEFNLSYKHWYSNKICLDVLYNMNASSLDRSELKFSVLYFSPIQTLFSKN